MPQSDGLPRNQKRANIIRRTDDPDAPLFAETPERERWTTEGNMFLDDDTGAGRRPTTPASRRATPASGMRSTTGSQGSPIPQRRTIGQVPPPPGASPSAKITQVHTARNTAAGARPKAQSPLTSNNKVHWLLPIGIGMFVMLILWEGGTFLLSWGNRTYDDLRYGTPRTYQMDAVVGHGGDSTAHPSHFIAMNLNRQAIVVEFPAGNPAGAQSYVVPYYILGQDGNLTPITLEFLNVTGHANDRLDMVIHIHLQTQDQTFVFVNDGTKFRPPTAQDHIHL